MASTLATCPPLALLTVTALLALPYPGRSQARQDSTEVAAPSGDLALHWRAEEVAVLGQSPPLFSRLEPRGLTYVSHERLAVLDLQARVTHLYSTNDWQHLRSFAPFGEGPGEVLFPWGLLTLHEEMLGLQDRTRKAILLYRSSGEFIRHVPVPFPMDKQSRLAVFGSSIVHHEATIDPSRVGPALRNGTRRINAALGGGLVLYSHSEQHGWGGRATVGTLEAQPLTRTDPGCRRVTLDPPAFSPRLVWDTNGRLLVLASTSEYLIHILSVAGRVIILRRPMPPVTVTIDQAATELGPISSSDGRCSLTAEARVRRAGWEPTPNWIVDLSISPSGQLFVRRRTPSLLHTLSDVYDPDGTYVGTLPPSFPWPDIWLSPTRFAFIETDEFDVPTVRIVEIRRE